MRSFSKSAKVFYRANKSLILSSVFVLLLLGLGGFWYYQRTAPARERARIVRQQEMVAGIIATGDLDQCAKAQGIIIEGVDYETVCRNNIHLNQARTVLNVSTCDKLENNAYAKDLCKQQIIFQSIVQGRNKDICNNSLPDQLRAFCLETYWTEQAVARDDIALCAKSGIDASVTRCMDNVLIEDLVFKKKPISCDMFSKSMQPGCELFKKDIALNATKLADCSAITNRVFESFCVNREYIHSVTLAP